MAMEEVLDGIRRIVHKWVNTTSLIKSDVAAGDTVISVVNARRFAAGDAVMLRNDTVYETSLYVQEIDEVAQTVTLVSPVLNRWEVANNARLTKTINEQFIQGIYIGEPDVIMKFPAITVNGVNRSSEWLTLESTKERYELEIGTYVQASTHEDGYRFLMAVTDEIQKGLKRNIQPLVSDYDIISLAENAQCGDVTLKVNNRNTLEYYKRIIIEDEYESQENWVTHLYPQDSETIRLKDPICFGFSTEDTSIVVPKRFIYNSWPHSIQYGTIHKGELLKASKISWFAEEEEMQFLRRSELKLR